MKHTRILLCILALPLSGCGMTPLVFDRPGYNERLEDDLDRREDRMKTRFERMNIRADARTNRWQRMKQWEDDRSNQIWDNLMN